MTMQVKELFDLSGRVAIVPGGSRGLGKEMVRVADNFLSTIRSG